MTIRNHIIIYGFMPPEYNIKGFVLINRSYITKEFIVFDTLL